ncbi:MAG: hydrophobic protein [Acidimicrobiia bacterium]|nr:MAG: hydrophobic protein [Acidimicrobiia bacterium]
MDEKLMRILLVVGAVVVAVVLFLWVLKVIWWLTIGVAVVLLIGFLLREKA